MEKNHLYVGIDLGYERALVSLYHAGLSEPVTVSTAAGEEKYQIPTAIFVGKQGNCFYGAEAVRRENLAEGEFYERLYREALSEETARLYHSRLVQYLSRLVRLREKYDFGDMPYTLAVAVPEITPGAVRVMRYVREQMELPKERFLLMDYGESFFAHTYHQERSVWQHDVALVDFSGNRMQSMLLHRNTRGTLQHVTAEKKFWEVPADVLPDHGRLDSFLTNVLQAVFAKRIVSGVYLVGNGFDGDWMRDSLRAVGPNRRVFLGKNLYTRGACYAAFRRDWDADWNFYYDCPYKMQGLMGLKLKKDGESKIIPLVQPGENWFDVCKSLYLLYDGDPALEARVQKQGERYARAEMLEFDGLADRAKKTVRLKLSVTASDGQTICLNAKDDGFGELFAPTDREWNFTIGIFGAS